MSKSNSTILKRSASTGRYMLALPADVRAKVGLKEGDSLVISTTPDGRIILRPKSGALRDLRGIVQTRIHASDQDIRRALDGKAGTSRPKRKVAPAKPANGK